MKRRTVLLASLVFSCGVRTHAEEALTGIQFPKLREKVEALGFPARALPLKLQDGKPPALSENGRPEAPDLKLSYAWDEEKKVPEALELELAPGEQAAALALMEELTGQKPKLEGGAQGYRLRFSGLAALKLSDLEFTRPLGGKKRNVKEYQLAFTALTAKQVALLASGAEPDLKPITAPVGIVLGAEYRQMKTRVREKRVVLNETESMVYLGRKPKDPKYKRIALTFPRPESGEDPSTLVTAVGLARPQFEIVLAREPQTLIERRNPRDWAFRDRDGVVAPELILPAQFDGQEALGAFIRVTGQEIDAFRPRTRELKLEVLLLEVKFKAAE